MRRKQTIIILPVGEKCNLSCSYCYHSPIRDQGAKVMSKEMLKRIIFAASKTSGKITFLWHGGEPLLAGINYFETAIKLQNVFLKEKIIKNIIQSNLVILNEKWINFLVENKISISTSLDGPKEMHDSNRYFPSGRGSFEQVSTNIRKLRSRKIRVGCITLITKTNVKYPEKVYETLKNVGVSSVAFHFCSETEDCISHLIPTQKAGANFLKRIFDMWTLDDNPDFRIRNFENIIRHFFNGRPLDCASSYNSCPGFVAIDQLGDVYPCNRFAGRKDFLIGNILDKSLSTLLYEARPLYKKITKIKKECLKCKWFGLCGGGCAYERLFFSNGSFDGGHPDCELKKELFSYVWEYLEDFYKSEKLNFKGTR
jgi:uncharacterized protein